MKKRVTSVDVAKAAGVSQSTVSMILNGKRLPAFTDDTIRRVLDAAEHLGYAGVRGERAGGGDAIVIFCPVLSNPYYSGIVQAVEKAAYAKGLRTVICTTYRNPEIELSHLRQLNISEIAGIVFTYIPLHTQQVETINRQIPVVVIGDRDGLIDVDTVEVNSYRAGACVVEYLMELGHRRFAFVSTTLNEHNTIRVKRMEGARNAALADGNCSFLVKARDVSSFADMSDPNIEYKVGYELTLECLGDDEPTAILCVNDMVAYGAIDALRFKQRSIPEEFSVCGFDNIFPSHFSAVSLSSIENCMLQKGQHAVDILHQRIAQRTNQQGNDRSITRIEYPPKLVVRDSIGPARKTSPVR